jgi:hypothetical protein
MYGCFELLSLVDVQCTSLPLSVCPMCRLCYPLWTCITTGLSYQLP